MTIKYLTQLEMSLWTVVAGGEMCRVLDPPVAREYNGNYNGWSDLPNGGHIEAAVSSYHVDMTDRGDLNATSCGSGFQSDKREDDNLPEN